MVNVAQLVEPRVVISVVVGSSPIVHPSCNKHSSFFQKITIQAMRELGLQMEIHSSLIREL